MLLAAAFALAVQALPQPEPAYRRPANRIAGHSDIRIMVLRTAFENDTDPKVSRHSEQEMNAIGDSLKEYFKIQSYGLLSVKKFEVSPVVTLRKSSVYERTDKDGKATPEKQRRAPLPDAINAANKLLGRNLAKEFDFICVVVNASPTGGRIGRPGVAAFATGPTNSMYFAAKPQWRVFAHEIGHNFGFGHAWSVKDNKGEKSLAPERTFTEYGDPVTPMGRGANSYSVVERYRMGWIGNQETDPRYIKKFEEGEFAFGAYDRPDAKGLVGGYLTGDFGVEVRELVSRRDDPDEAAAATSVKDPGPQRIWFSVISRGELQRGMMPDLKTPILFAHLSSLVAPAKGNARASTTVSLDLAPSPSARPRKPMQRYGLTPGQVGSIPLKDGKSLRVRFVKYDAATHTATVRAVTE